MATYYKTKEGDTVDLIAWRYYGRQDNQIVEKVLEENYGLAGSGETLPENIEIFLPDIPEPDKKAGVRLWD